MKQKKVILSTVEQRFLFRLLDERYNLVESNLYNDVSDNTRANIRVHLDFINGIQRKLDLIFNDAL